MTQFIAGRRWLKKLLPAFLPPRVVFTTPAGTHISLLTKDLRGPSFHVLFGGGEGFLNYEKLERDEIVKLLPERGVFLDIGANVGLFTFSICERMPRVRVHAFEPHPELFKCLEETVASNRLSNEITLHAVALGKKAGHFRLFLDESDSGGHSLKQEVLQNNKLESSSHRVRVIPLDDLAEVQSLDRIDVIKIDVQGAELECVSGAARTFEKFRPAILIECENEKLLRSENVLTTLLSVDPDYTVHRIGHHEKIRSGQIASIAREELNVGRLQSNYFCVRS